MATIALSRDAAKQNYATLPMLAEALGYAAKGWLVIPLNTPTSNGCTCGSAACSSPGKHPRTRNGLKEATTDPSQITRWWHKWPDANIGILTGPESQLCVVGVDGEEGRVTLAELTKRDDLPETLRALTGRKNSDGNREGFHLYFRLPTDKCLRNSVGRLGKGLDVRGTGGYVVAPPSLHASGLRYEWCSPEASIANAPAWLISAKPQLAVIGKTENAIPEGQRNNALTSLAGAMLRHDSSLATIESALLAENRVRCSPPLLEKEVRRIAASVSRYAPGEQITRLAPTRRPDLVRLSDVPAKSVSWLWEPYLPREMITILSGDPGAGKTYLALAIAAALTCGETVIGGQPVAPGNVLYLTLENSPAHVLRPRFA